MTLKGQYALRDVNRASFGARHENLKEDRRILSAAKICSPRSYTFRRYKVHGDTRGGCVAIGRQTTVECFLYMSCVTYSYFSRMFSDLCCPACIASGNFILEFHSMRAPPNQIALIYSIQCYLAELK